jgi:hypothetical protein
MMLIMHLVGSSVESVSNQQRTPNAMSLESMLNKEVEEAADVAASDDQA